MSDMGREIRNALLSILKAWESGDLVLVNGKDDSFDPEVIRAFDTVRRATTGTVPTVK